MNQLVFVQNKQPVTDSLTVAEVFGKDHKRVLQDIRELGCSEEFGRHNFVLSSYNTSQNKELPKYIMTQDGFTLLVMGYTGQKAMEFKEKYIAEFNQMRKEIRLSNRPSYEIDDPVQRAQRWIEEEKRRRALETENLMLEQRVAEYEPKVTYLDQILQSTDTVTITQIAKDYGLTGQELNKILNEEKVQYKQNDQWLLYKKYHAYGYTKSQTIDVLHNSGQRSVKMNTRWTQKGRLFIHELLTKRGIVANLDRELEKAK
ncbi:phage regulatory protein/antirepressor Ant [Fodinisporobacter ferrooxydans]|uniref:Phage regulatory protein/antirepressor Ant n=1 Tax=Fodinisporobacter ferrooxydans TaxID=2901836 RepID=A0ABY4CJV0_9BACL|nr:phage regulatory protein/antirepressor Ant [Alicyclobacillaceae bacterium MYW30-H2]